MSFTNLERCNSDNMVKEIKKYLLNNPNVTVLDIEDFLGYPASPDVLEDLESHIDDVLEQMPEETFNYFYVKFGI